MDKKFPDWKIDTIPATDKKLILNWTIEEVPNYIYKDAKATIHIKELTIGDTVYFYDYFGLVRAEVIDEKHIRSGVEPYPNGSQWYLEKTEDGSWAVAGGYSERALEMFNKMLEGEK